MEDESFHVDVLTFSILKELASVWADKDFSELLAEMEFGSTQGMGHDELREMCLLALQDLAPEEAAALVLRYRLGDRLNAGQISNIAADMPEEKPWEEYANMALHEQLFNVASLLWMAFPKIFPEPDAVRVLVKVSALHDKGRKILERSLNESFLVRLLAGGMGGDSVLQRLFDEQLVGDSFPEAESIIWTFRVESMTEDTCVIEVISSGSWLDPLRSTKSYTTHAYPDIGASPGAAITST